MQTTYMGGVPRVESERLSIKRTISTGQPPIKYLSKPIKIDGTKTRDSGNTPTDAIRPGLLMGQVTTGGKYAPSIIGVLQSAYTSGGLAITLSLAQAAELLRRVGATGSVIVIGPPSAAGTVAVSASKAYSAIDTATGIVTIVDIGANMIAGSFVVATDGSGIPHFVISETDGIKVTDQNGTSQDQDYWPAVEGGLVFGQILPVVPTDTSLITWVKTQLRLVCLYIWDTDF